jgi:probable phosphoglycerate mutase
MAAGDARPNLNDIDYGGWQFKTHEDAKQDDPAFFAAWFATPQLVRLP